MASSAGPITETIPFDELAIHNTLESLWIAVHGHVYDLTKFSTSHPGGVEALHSSAGTDGSEVYEYAGHSEDNMIKMQQYRIGKLPEDTQVAMANSHSNPTLEKAQVATVRPQQVHNWRKLSAILVSVTLVLATYLLFALPPRANFPLGMRMPAGQTTGYEFWAGMTLASSVSLVVFRYFHKMFLSTLDYENDVFSLPPVIPRRTRR